MHMIKPDPLAMLAGVVLFVAALVVLIAVTAIRRRRGQDFEVRPLPADRLGPYRQRMDELETLFVTRPRQAVAGGRQVVDDMLAQMGYPARLGPDDRVRDIAFTNRGHAMRYRTAAIVGERSSTEEMRQAMVHLLAMGRDLVAEPAAPSARQTSERQLAG